MPHDNLVRKLNAACRALSPPDPELCGALQAAYNIALAKGYVTGEVTAEVVQPKDD